MSEGGSVKLQLKQALERQQKLHDQLKEEGLAPPQMMYMFGQTQWIHHIIVRSLEKLVVEVLGVEEDRWKLMITETWIEELEHLAKSAREMKREQLRQQLTQGIHIKPDVQL